MSHLPAIRPQEETDRIVNFLKETFAQANKTTAIVALSGGIDSSTSATLAVKTLGAEHVHVLILPSLQSTGKNTEDGHRMAEYLQIPETNIHEIHISAAQEAIATTLKLYNVDRTDQSLQGRLGNIAARLRMIFIYDQAKALDALVVGTENLSEHFLGYFTRFGDEASDIEPLRHLYKTQVYALAAHLKVPQEIIKKAPTADLWSGQTDEAELGFSYALADPILYHHFEENMTASQVITQGYSEDLVHKVFQAIDKAQFKHHVPHLLK